MSETTETGSTGSGDISELLLEKEMRESYLNYSLSVIRARALPDVRDGLKPSQRRILYAMQLLGLGPRSKYRKCAKICGDTSGNFHPHGESVVYPTLVGMFLTPVFWSPGTGGGVQEAFYRYNPFTYFLEIVRDPIMTGQPNLVALSYCALMTFGLWLAAFLLLGKFRRQVALVS